MPAAFSDGFIVKKILDMVKQAGRKAPALFRMPAARTGANRTGITGLRLGAELVEWTTLRDMKGGVEVMAANTAALPQDAGPSGDNQERSEQLKFHCAGISTAVTVGLPPDKMLMRVADLPTTDPAEMQSMIQLQVDAFSPFPDDRINVSYEVIEKHANGVRVMIAAVQKDLVEKIGGILKALGLDAQRIDADAMAWWRLIAENAMPSDPGRHLILVVEHGGGLWIAIQDNLPLAFRAVPAPDGMPFEEFAMETARDAASFLLAIDLEHGSSPLAGLAIYCRGIDGPALASALRGEIQHDPEIHSLDELPPASEGLARRFIGTGLTPQLTRSANGRAVLDLVPVSWRSALQAQRLRRRLIAASIGILAAWAAAMALFFGLYQYQNYRLAKLDKKLAVLQKPAEEVRLMQNQCRSFEQYLDRQYSALECLREASQNLPKEVLLTTFQFKKGKSLVLRGEALAVNAIYDYKQALDKSPLFARIEMGSVQPGKRKDTSVNTFQMTARFKEQK